MIGEAIAHYRITAKLGAGGMGEVYRATDTKLNREVAIKVLPASFAQDPERMARFEREAKVLAALNHPNIAQIHGIEERALVMELVEGERLAGPVPLETALNYARQIADALEAAHDKGIVHRDLKPANINITPQGVLKVLDFGLAKAADEPAGDPRTSPTLTISPTRAGLILGTAAYMSPEQARGKPVDKRADIWAFGVVLYEMLAGRQLFQGETVSDTLAAVLKEEPDFDRVPYEVRRLLRSCLAKDPKQRLQAIGDWRLLLDRATGSEALPPPPQARATWLPWAVAALLVIAFAALGFIHFRETPPDAPVTITSILPPDNASFDFTVNWNPPVLSPDGRLVVFGARGADRKIQLWLRPLDSPTAQPLAGTETARFPFWSPDSRSIAFFADGKLKRLDVGGGPALTLADAPNPRGGSWSSLDVIVFAAANAGPLLRVPSSGGAVTAATVTGNDYNHRFPWFLPDGKHFLFEDEEQAGAHETALRIASLDSRAISTITRANSNAIHSSGYILYLRENTLMAQPFDEKRLATTGEAVPIAEQVQTALAGGPVGIFSLSRTGLLTYLAGQQIGSQQLAWYQRDGKPLETLGEAGDFLSLDLSPDRTNLAATRAGQNDDLWIYEVQRGLATRFTFSPAVDREAVWSPNGRSIVYQSNPKGQFDLYLKASDGSGTEALLYSDGATKIPSSWSADGRYLLFDRLDSKSLYDIWVLPLSQGAVAASSKPYPWLVTQFNERWGKFSPDGRWVAYESDESGQMEIYVAPFPGPGGKRQVSSGGGQFPRWRADGKEIFYVGPNGAIAGADVSAQGSSLEVAAVHALGVPVLTNIAGRFYQYDVSADGQRFLIAAPREQQSSTPLTLVQNWTQLLKKK